MSGTVVCLDNAVSFTLMQNSELRRYTELSVLGSPLMLLVQLDQRFKSIQVNLRRVESDFDRIQRLRYGLVRNHPFRESLHFPRLCPRSIDVPQDDRCRPEWILIFQ